MSETRQKVEYVQTEHLYRFHCPHCGIIIEVEENQVNCQIFRCGRMKSTGKQVNPHSPKEHCDRLLEKGLVWGCCKPFKFFNDTSPYVDICGYI